MYQPQKIAAENSLVEIKNDIKRSILSLLSMQVMFHLLVILFIQILSFLQLSSSINILNPQGVSSFAADMWFIVFILTFMLIGYAILNKVKELPLYLLTVYPAVLVIISMIRDVSSLQVIVFALLSAFVVLKINYQKIKQVECSQA